MQVSGANIAGQKPTPVRTVAADTSAGGRLSSDENDDRDKLSSGDRQATAQDRIRAKLLAISEQSAVDDVKKMEASHSRDAKTLSRVRSRSPKRQAHVCLLVHCQLMFLLLAVGG